MPQPPFHERLRFLMGRTGMTVEELANTTSVDHEYLYRIERGEIGEDKISFDTVVRLAGGLGVSPRDFFQAHPMEAVFNASVDDILGAIEHGFRAQADVKGKLAEFFLFPILQELERQGVISDLEWLDKDGKPDFTFEYNGKTLRIECKNVRNILYPHHREKCLSEYEGYYCVESQKTRQGKKRKPKAKKTKGGQADAVVEAVEVEQTRGYKVGHFEILAACLFNQNGKWEYLFTSADNLISTDGVLAVFQPVPQQENETWKTSLTDVLEGLPG